MLDITSNIQLALALPPVRRNTIMTAWNDERIQILKQLVQDGLSAAQLADRFGVSRSAIIGKCHREGFRLRGSKVKSEKKKVDRRKGPYRTPRIAEMKNRKPVPILEWIEPEVPAEFLHITFDNLQRNHCKYPRGEGRSITFCGQPRIEDRPYCASCCRLAYDTPRTRQSKKKHEDNEANYQIRSNFAAWEAGL
jgi:GcrA cell cycle regulator